MLVFFVTENVNSEYKLGALRYCHVAYISTLTRHKLFLSTT